MGAVSDPVYCFGPFRFEASSRTLTKDGAALPLRGRAAGVLLALISRRGRLVTKPELLEEVWSSLNVEENNLTTQVLNLRKLLAAHDPDTRYIVTEAGRGYRFVAPLTELPAMAPAPAPLAGTVPDNIERNNLPAETNSFIGREAELQDIAGKLTARAMVTLTGSGGIGKTRCALRVAHETAGEFQDGVWLVELAPLSEGASVAEALCRAIGAPFSGNRPAIDVAVDFLRQSHMLIILDNCEHVLEDAALTSSAILRHCPRVKILATSREKLGIAGEAVFRMPPMGLPAGHGALSALAALQSDSVRLFVERANDVAGHYVLTDEDAPAVAMICRRLDGMPMATELAAARLRMHKAAEIAARLEDVFRLLTGGSKAALPRQQTLRATIDWSHALLSPQEQIVLRRLSVFVDGFTLAGATAVATSVPGLPDDDIFDFLTALVDKSLVGADTSGAVTRFRMLETTRHYAREKLDASNETAQIRRAMAEYLAAFYQRGEGAWGTASTVRWLEEFGPESENLRASVEWSLGTADHDGADVALGIRLVSVAGSLTEEMSLQADMRRWAERASALLTDATPPGQTAWVLYWCVRHKGIFGVGEVSDARRRMIASFRQAGDKIGLSCALRTTGMAIARPGDNKPDAFDMLSEAVALLRPLGRTKDLATALAHLGSLHYFNGNHNDARALNVEALDLRRALGDRTGIAASFLNLGEFAFVRGDVQEAIAHATNAVRQSRDGHLLEMLAMALNNLANYLLGMDDCAGAMLASAEALPLLRALGNHDYAIFCLEHLALHHALSGNYRIAARLYGFASQNLASSRQDREPADRIGADRLAVLLDANLAPDLLAGLMEEGAGLTSAEADQLALAQAVPDLTAAPVETPGGMITARSNARRNNTQALHYDGVSH